MKDTKNAKAALIGIVLGMLFWVFDSAIDAYVFDYGNLVKQILHPALLEV